MADNEYPKAAYALGGDTDVWGRMMFVRSLIDAQDEADAKADGWALHPMDLPGGDDDEIPVARRRGRPPKVRTDGDGD